MALKNCFMTSTAAEPLRPALDRGEHERFQVLKAQYGDALALAILVGPSLALGHSASGDPAPDWRG